MKENAERPPVDQSQELRKKNLLTSSSSSVRHCLCPRRDSCGSRGISEGRIRLFGLSVVVEDEDEDRRLSLLLLFLFFFLSPPPAATAGSGSSGVLVKKERL